MTNEEGKTPLFIAGLKGHVAVIETLDKYGADPNITDKKNRSPIYAATRNENDAAIKALAKMGGDVNLAHKSGNVPMSVAAFYGYNETIKTLCNLGAEINHKNNDGNTPLHLAVHKDCGGSDGRGVRILISTITKEINGLCKKPDPETLCILGLISSLTLLSS